MICMNVLLAPLPLSLRRFGACSRRNRRRCNRGRCDRRGMYGCPGHHHARGLGARCAACKRHESNVPRALDGHAQPALMARAHASHPARQNFSALLHELRQDVRALVVDEIHLLDAELAHLLLPEILALAPGPSSGTARTTAPWAAFAPRTAVSSAGSVAT